MLQTLVLFDKLKKKTVIIERLSTIFLVQINLSTVFIIKKIVWYVFEN